MSPIMAIDLAMSFLEAGFRVNQLAQQAMAEGREVNFDDVRFLVNESNLKRAAFDAALAEWEAQG